jgi:RNA polymerase sigma factor (sigma-70 family)
MSNVVRLRPDGKMRGERHGAPLVDRPQVAAGRSGSTDHRLLQRCAAGEERAWDELVGRYERLVFSVALKNGVSREDAADITQLTFVALLESIEVLREDASLPYWLVTVARRQAWRVRRRTQREQPWPAEEMESESGATEEDYERIAVVHGALARLGTRCRQLLYALFFDPDDPPYAVIADRLDCAVGSIGPQRARCLERMRTLLNQDAAE